jgi:hypothetical protein
VPGLGEPLPRRTVEGVLTSRHGDESGRRRLVEEPETDDVAAHVATIPDGRLRCCELVVDEAVVCRTSVLRVQPQPGVDRERADDPGQLLTVEPRLCAA